MASVLHGSARTTPRIRAELKAAQAPARVLASQYGLNVKTVLKWRNRADTTDARMGPKSKSTVLTPGEEAIIVEFRRRTLLPLDDVLSHFVFDESRWRHFEALPRLPRDRTILPLVIAAWHTFRHATAANLRQA